MAAEFVQRGRLCVEQGHLQEAVRVCRLGLLANPGDVEGRVVLASALMALARYDEVLGEMKSALDLQPGNPSALALQGEALLRKGDGARALVVLEQAALAAPGDPYVEGLRAEASAVAASGPSPFMTVDIDPQLEGVEIREEEIEPMEVSAQDLLEVEPDIEELDADLLMEATPTPQPRMAPLPGPGLDDGPFEDMRGTRVEDEPPQGMQASLPSPSSAPLPARSFSPLPEPLPEPPLADIPMMDAPTPDPDTPDPELPDPEHVRAAMAEVSRHPSSPFVLDEDTPEPSPGRRLQTIGTLFPDDEPPTPEPTPGRPATIGTLFPDDETPTPTPAPVRPRTAGRTSDMEMIRHGLSEPRRGARISSSVPLSTPPSIEIAPALREKRHQTAEAPVRGKKGKKGKRTRGIPMAAWGALALLAMAGGAAGGLKVRELRLDRQIDTANAEIAKLLKGSSYLGHKKARDWIARIHEAQKSDRSLARLAAIEARIAGEFGDDAARAKALLAKVSKPDSQEALEASAYLAIAQGDADEALAGARLLLERAPDAWVSHYLHGLSLVLAGNGEEAKAALDKAIGLSPTLLSYVALARAEALLANYPEAIAAIGRATAIADNHPSAVIWQARILVEASELPKNPSDPDELLMDVIKRSRGAGEVSASHGAWAGLVLAEIKIQRGDIPAAKKAIAEATVARPKGWMFSEMLADLLIRLGQWDEALAETEKASQTWPRRVKPRISRANIRLAQGDPNAALEVLEEVQGIENLPEALSVRGQAYLRLGTLDEAATDLDRALTLRPRFADATIARARVDILRGQPKQAIGRLEPMYDRTAGPELAVAYAAALRTSGNATEAREVLEPLAGDDGTLIAIIELARLERSEGRFEEARKVFERAIEIAPQSMEAQLGAAELDIDDGRVQEGREALDALVAKGTRNGQVLLAAARARTLTGDTVGATELLDQVNAAWLGWMVARERGRILLNRLSPIEALSELQRAQGLRPTDAETWQLLMEAHLESTNKRGSARALEEITKTFRNAPLRASAAGLHALLTDRAQDAVASFTEARSLLLESKGSRLELAHVAYWLGRSYEILGDFRQAGQWLQKATSLNPTHALAYYWAGQVYHLEEKFDKMVESYEKAVALDPGIAPMAWFFLGNHYGTAGRKDDAIRALEMFLQYYPENSGDMVVDAKVLLVKLRS